MKILGFDTSPGICSVALFDGQKCLSLVKETKNAMQVERLLPMIESVLDANNCTYGDIDRVAVSVGPGSFTGIRIGVAAARAISFASGINLISVTNFDMLYHRAIEQIKSYSYIVTLINAYRNECYVDLYDTDGHVDDFQPALMALYDVVSLLTELQLKIKAENMPIVIVGSGVYEIMQLLSACHKSIILLPRFPNPDARFVCKSAMSKINNLFNLLSIASNPLYIRQPDAKLPAYIVN